jgi:hypothetical protein
MRSALGWICCYAGKLRRNINDSQTLVVDSDLQTGSCVSALEVLWRFPAVIGRWVGRYLSTQGSSSLLRHDAAFDLKVPLELQTFDI